MDTLIDVPIPVDAEAAEALERPGERQAIGRYISHLMKHGGMRSAVVASIAELKQEAHANGLTDAEVDQELAAWKDERRA